MDKQNLMTMFCRAGILYTQAQNPEAVKISSFDTDVIYFFNFQGELLSVKVNHQARHSYISKGK